MGVNSFGLKVVGFTSGHFLSRVSSKFTLKLVISLGISLCLITNLALKRLVFYLDLSYKLAFKTTSAGRYRRF
jgi:hypothetical protein